MWESKEKHEGIGGSEEDERGDLESSEFRMGEESQIDLESSSRVSSCLRLICSLQKVIQGRGHHQSLVFGCILLGKVQ